MTEGPASVIKMTMMMIMMLMVVMMMMMMMMMMMCLCVLNLHIPREDAGGRYFDVCMCVLKLHSTREDAGHVYVFASFTSMCVCAYMHMCMRTGTSMPMCMIHVRSPTERKQQYTRKPTCIDLHGYMSMCIYMYL